MVLFDEKEQRILANAPEGSERCFSCSKFFIMIERRDEGRVICPGCGTVQGAVIVDDWRPETSFKRHFTASRIKGISDEHLRFVERQNEGLMFIERVGERFSFSSAIRRKAKVYLEEAMETAKGKKWTRIQVWSAVLLHLASIELDDPVPYRHFRHMVENDTVRWGKVTRRALDILRLEYPSWWRVTEAYISQYTHRLALSHEFMLACRCVLRWLREALDRETARVDVTRDLTLKLLTDRVHELKIATHPSLGATDDNYMQQMLHDYSRSRKRKVDAMKLVEEHELVLPPVQDTRRNPSCLAAGIVYLVIRICGLRKECTQKSLRTCSGVCVNTISKTSGFIRTTIGSALDSARLTRIYTRVEEFKR